MITRLPLQAATALTVISLAFSLTGFAQTAPSPPISGAQLVARRTLLERAQAASRARDYAQALSLAQQAGNIEMTPSLRMFLAQQQQELGHHADAMESAEYCVREATHNQALERREIILGECRRLSAVSQRQVVLVTITVSPRHHQSLAIRVGTRAVRESEYNIPIVLDPGRYEIVATSPGQPIHEEIAVGAPGTTITVNIPSRFEVSQPQVTNPVTTAVTGVETGTTNTSVNNHQNGPIATNTPLVQPGIVHPAPGLLARVGAGPWVLIGTGVAGFVTAGAFFVLRNGQFSTCRPVGEMIVCDTDEAARQWMSGAAGSPDPYTFNTLTNVSLAVGGVALLGGAIWFAVNAARSPERSTVTVETAQRAQRAQRAPARMSWGTPSLTATSFGFSFGATL